MIKETLQAAANILMDQSQTPSTFYNKFYPSVLSHCLQPDCRALWSAGSPQRGCGSTAWPRCCSNISGESGGLISRAHGDKHHAVLRSHRYSSPRKPNCRDGGTNSLKILLRGQWRDVSCGSASPQTAPTDRRRC